MGVPAIKIMLEPEKITILSEGIDIADMANFEGCLTAARHDIGAATELAFADRPFPMLFVAVDRDLADSGSRSGGLGTARSRFERHPDTFHLHIAQRISQCLRVRRGEAIAAILDRLDMCGRAQPHGLRNYVPRPTPSSDFSRLREKVWVAYSAATLSPCSSNGAR